MSDSTKAIPILRQSNPSGRITYYTPSKWGMQKLSRPTALSMIDRGEAYWAGKPFERMGGPGAPSVGALIAAAHDGLDLSSLD